MEKIAVSSEAKVSLTGYDFEIICAKILKSKGFSDVRVTRGSGDQGADILAWKDGTRYAIQCKFYSHPVGNKAVQEVYASMAFYGCTRSIVMTNSSFTKSSRELARKTGTQLWGNVRPEAPKDQVKNQAKKTAKNSFVFKFLFFGIAVFIVAIIFFPQKRFYLFLGLVLFIILHCVLYILVRLISDWIKSVRNVRKAEPTGTVTVEPAVTTEPVIAPKEDNSEKSELMSPTIHIDFEKVDPLFTFAVDMLMDLDMVSVSMLQRRLSFSYSRASKLIDEMEEAGIVSPFNGSTPRRFLITKEQWTQIKEESLISTNTQR